MSGIFCTFQTFIGKMALIKGMMVVRHIFSIKLLRPVFLITFTFLLLITSVYAQPRISDKQAGVDHLRSGDYIRALDDFNKAIETEPFLPELYYLRGYTKYNLDDYIGAERDYSKSIDLSPYRSEVFVSRAVVRSQQENFTGAFEDYQKAVELDSANSDIYINRARTNLYLKKYYSCITDCNKAIRQKNKQEIVYILKGTSEMGIGRYDNAIEDLNKAVEINPQNIYSYTQRGLVWMELIKYDSAVNDFTRAIGVDSNNVYALFNRALARIKNNDQKGALNDLDKVTRISPYNAYAYYNRAILLIGMDDKKGAIRDFNYVSKLNPQNILSYYYRSLLKVDLKDYRGALEDLDRTIELFPDNADAYYERYVVRDKLKDRKGAKEDYDKAMNLKKKSQFAPDSLKSVKENYLKSLVKLSGEFEEMNTRNSKFQNQYIQIELFPIYNIYLGKPDYNKIRLYDAYQRGHYYMNVLMLTNHIELVHDSLNSGSIEKQTHLIDSLPGNALAHFRRAVLLAAHKNYPRSFDDFNAALNLDSTFVQVWFARANARYEYIQLLVTQDNLHSEITIETKKPAVSETEILEGLEQTYDSVIHDYNKALALDPDFYFVYYNRGFVNSKMGNYKKAIDDFSQAIHYKKDLAEAYYNRGLIYILQNERQKGCEDLSQAGELGILDAYKVMKRYCNE